MHPVNVQSVAWIAQRKNLLAMAFLLLSILWYVRSEQRAGASGARLAGAPDRWYWLSLAAFALAMLSKGSVATLPLLLLGIVWWMRPLRRGDLVRIVPFVIVSAALLSVTLLFQARADTQSAWSLGVLERLLGAGAVVWFYLQKALLPVRLSFIYPQWRIAPSDWRWWLPLLSALTVTAVLWRARAGWGRPLLAAWGWFCLALAPAMGFTYVVFMAEHSLVADHYQHIALIGVVALVAAAWTVWRRRAAGWVPVATAVFAVALLATLTWRQSSRYADAVTLFRAARDNAPDSAAAHNNLGFVLLQAGRSEEAQPELEEALRLDPDLVQAHNNLGAALARAGRFDAAIAHFERAARLRPDDPGAHHHLGAALRESGRPNEAIAHFTEALRLRPVFAEAHCQLGNAFFQSGRTREAIEQFRAALRDDPDLADAHNGLGAALLETGRRDEAIAHLREALRLSPDHQGARDHLEHALVKD